MSTRRAAVNTDLSQYQANLQTVFELRSFGYSSCMPDGNCGFNTVSQLLYSQDHAIHSILDLPPRSQAEQGSLWKAVAKKLLTDCKPQPLRNCAVREQGDA